MRAARQRAHARYDDDTTSSFRDPERGVRERNDGKYDKISSGKTVESIRQKTLASVRRIFDHARARPKTTAVVLMIILLIYAGRSSEEPVGAAVGASTAAAPRPSARASGPKLVPRVIHQTFKSRASLTVANKAAMETWRVMNPLWEVRFYDDDDCERFVGDHFPEYAEAYASLEKKVEQSDFFRYLVVLKHGGVYADIDTECRRPLDDVVDAKDTFVVGWEDEFATDARAYSRHFVRRRQMLNWVFAGAPGHPALIAVAEHIKNGATKVFTKASNRNTLERTGPGAFTDAVMKHFEYVRVSGEKSWNVKVLPKVIFGTHPLGEEGVSQSHPDVFVAHKYSGGWKQKTGWNGRRSWTDHVAILYHSIRNDLPRYRERAALRDENFQMPAVDKDRMYPVNVMWSPSFDLLNPLLGTAVPGIDAEVRGSEGYWLTLYGRPRVVMQKPLRAGENPAEILFYSLERTPGESAVFVDIGAGFGYYSLAAALMGDVVHAYEWGKKFLPHFKAAIEHNNLVDKIKIGTQHETLSSGDEFKRLLGLHDKIDAMRIAGRGFDCEIFEGFKTLLEAGKHPRVLMFESRTALVRALSAEMDEDVAIMFEYLWNQGYTDVGHVGPACDGRGVRKVKSHSRGQKSKFEGTSWCRADESSFKGIVNAMHEYEAEVVMMFHTSA